MLNKTLLIGNLGQDPELKYTEGGQAISTLSLATNRKWKNKQGELQEDVQWHRIVVWGQQAEHCKQYLAKGKQVYIEGRLQTRKWQDKDGQDRWTTEIVAEKVIFLGSKGEGGSRGQDAPPPMTDDDLPF